MKITFAAALTILLLVAFPVRGEEVCLERACFPRTIELAGEPVRLRGIGDLDWYLWNVYVAAFYDNSDATGTASIVSEQPVRLVIHYQRSISAEDFVEVTEKTIVENGGGDPVALREDLDRLAKAYRSVDRNDRYTMTWLPGEGFTIDWNDETIFETESEEFARAFLAIWVSDNAPIDKALCEKLLSGKP